MLIFSRIARTSFSVSFCFLFISEISAVMLSNSSLSFLRVSSCLDSSERALTSLPVSSAFLILTCSFMVSRELSLDLIFALVLRVLIIVLLHSSISLFMFSICERVASSSFLALSLSAERPAASLSIASFSSRYLSLSVYFISSFSRSSFSLFLK